MVVLVFVAQATQGVQEGRLAGLFDVSAISIGHRRLGDLSRADNRWKWRERSVRVCIMQLE